MLLGRAISSFSSTFLLIIISSIIAVSSSQTSSGCYDYIPTEYNSSDGNNEMQFNYQQIDIQQYTMINNSNNDANYHYTANNTNSYFTKKIQCHDPSDCIIICNDTAGCLLSEMEVDNANNDVIIACNQELSCFTASINISSASDINIICSALNSCQDMEITVNDFNSLNIYCVTSGSCQDMHIYLEIDHHETNDTDNEGIIHCVAPNSCDRLQLFTTSQSTQLIMYEYSENVVVDNGFGYLSKEDNLMCNMDRFIKYDTNTNQTPESVSKLILMEYELNELPCNGIEVKCGNASCFMEYSFETSKLETLKTELMDSAGCYWINVQELQKIECNGECESSPSEEPTPSPTRVPTTEDAYDSYIDVIYGLKHLSHTEVSFILKNTMNFTQRIAILIEESYVNHIQWFLDYTDFWVVIEDIDGHSVEKFANDPDNDLLLEDEDLLKLGSIIKCTQDRCNEIINKYEQNKFTNLTTETLKTYFDSIETVNAAINDELEFIVIEMSLAKQLNPESDKFGTAGKYVFYGVTSVTTLIVLTGIFAFLFNKGAFPRLPGFAPVDDAKWTAVMIYALQFWDFASDINLSVEIIYRDDLFTNRYILIAAGGCTFFVLIPYIVNLIIAASVKNLIKNNQVAKGWFHSHTPVFTILVVLCGGCYAAISLVSSNIFGLKLMSCGLTQYELKTMGKIKVWGTVILENVPQLISQLLYAYTIDSVTNALVIAFIASAISVITTTLSYLIERDISDTKVVQYYLSTQCTERVIRNNSKHHDDRNEIEFGFSLDKQISTWSHQRENELRTELKSVGSSSDNNKSYDTITRGEKLNLLNGRGRTQALGESLARVFGIPPKNIEIGFSMLTMYGLITHIVHYVYDLDLETMQMEIENEMIKANNHSKMKINVTPKFFTSQLYASLQNEIDHAFRDHFDLNGDFKVTHHHKLSIKARTMSFYADIDEFKKNDDTKENKNGDKKDDKNDDNEDRDNNDEIGDRRQTVIKRMVSSIEYEYYYEDVDHKEMDDDDSDDDDADNNTKIKMAKHIQMAHLAPYGTR